MAGEGCRHRVGVRSDQLASSLELAYAPAMPDDGQAPATKEDVRLLMESIGRLYDANERWKEEVKEHFDVVVEQLRHDLLGASKDKVELHEDRLADHARRLTRLERRAGLVA